MDTAPNYLAGRAHRLLAPVLAEHGDLRVSTKVGFPAPGAAAAVAAGAFDAEAARRGYSLAAGYVGWQVERNRATLGRCCLDTVFLHNPERTGDRAALPLVLREAFAVLEAAVAAAQVAAYGIATWSGFTEHFFTIPQLDRLAAEAAGTPNHHLRAVQLPVSLVQTDTLHQALEDRGPIRAAAERGWQVFASAPLHGGELVTAATEELAALLRPGLTVAQACLLAAASCPGLTKVLLSASNPAHWESACAELAQPAIPPPILRKVCDALAPTTQADEQRALAAQHEAAAALGITLNGPRRWGYQGHTLGQQAQHPEYGACCLRLISAPSEDASGKLWEGTAQAAAAFRGVRKPALHGVYDESVRDGIAYRAELTTYIDDPACAPEPVLGRELEPPETWWKSLRTDLEAIAATPTERVAVRRQ
ncbi:aldo/keto reductase [Streptomyces sp. NPDC101150]|uniref:aldo/keto reductase n=1 Tax=Streptomyces sp. NPDC101150 TaxID=3366114 RepID=UPI00381C672B